jgi:hypothetical protein
VLTSSHFQAPGRISLTPLLLHIFPSIPLSLPLISRSFLLCLIPLICLLFLPTVLSPLTAFHFSFVLPLFLSFIIISCYSFSSTYSISSHSVFFFTLLFIALFLSVQSSIVSSILVFLDPFIFFRIMLSFLFTHLFLLISPYFLTLFPLSAKSVYFSSLFSLSI